MTETAIADKPELGKIAFEAYIIALEGEEGEDIPTWDELLEDEQLAWQLAVKAVLTYLGG